MSIYFIRIIELMSLDSLEENYYIRALLHTTSTQPIDMLWQVEPHIAKQIHIYCDFNVKSRYRLSLKPQATPEGGVTATISKTHLTMSQRFEFSITEQFAQQLQQMNRCPNPIHLLQLPYVVTAEQFLDLKEREVTKPKAVQKKPFDLSNIAPSAIIQPKQVLQKQQPSDTPIFTYHPSENSAVFTSIVKGSQAI